MCVINYVEFMCSARCVSEVNSSSYNQVYTDRSIFNESMYVTYSSTGYNFRYGYLHIKSFCIPDFNFDSIIRQIRCYHGLHSPFECLIEILSHH